MKNFVIGLILSVFVFSVTAAQEITTAENFLTGYESVWQMEDNLEKEKVYIGEDYFGVCNHFGMTKKSQVNFTYKHYNSNGELLWSIEDPEHNTLNITISQKGNRVIVSKKYNFGDMEKFYILAKVYDENGDILFSCPKHHVFESSPTGKFYYSVAKYNTPYGLILLDENGNKLYEQPGVPYELETMFKTPDDSTLIIADTEGLFILNTKAKTITSKRFDQAKDYICHTYSNKAEKLVSWASYSNKDISVIDRDFNELAVIHEDFTIRLAQIADDSKTLGLLLVDDSKPPGQWQRYIKIIRLDGTMIDQVKYTLPSERRLVSHPDEIYYDSKYFIHRYIGPHTETDKSTKYCSTIFTIDPATNKIASSAYLNSWLFPMENENGFLEISNTSIKTLSKKGDVNDE